MSFTEFTVVIPKKSSFDNEEPVPLTFLMKLLEIATSELEEVIVLNVTERFSTSFKFIFKNKTVYEEGLMRQQEALDRWQENEAKKNTQAEEDIPF